MPTLTAASFFSKPFTAKPSSGRHIGSPKGSRADIYPKNTPRDYVPHKSGSVPHHIRSLPLFTLDPPSPFRTPRSTPPPTSTPSTIPPPRVEELEIVFGQRLSLIFRIAPWALADTKWQHWVIESLYRIVSLPMFIPRCLLSGSSIPASNQGEQPPNNPLWLTAYWEIYAHSIMIAGQFEASPSKLVPMLCLMWMRRLLLKDPLTPTTPAIYFAERHGLVKLLATAMYAYLVENWQEVQGEDEWGHSLTSKQRTHILAGYYSLRTLNQTIAMSPPLSVKSADICECNQAFGRVFRQLWVALGSAVDVVGKYRHLQQIITRRGRGWGLCQPCVQASLEELKMAEDTVFCHLADHFDLD